MIPSGPTFRDKRKRTRESSFLTLEPIMRILPFLALVLVTGTADLLAQAPGGPPPRTANDDTTVASSRLAIVHATIESAAGNRFCVGDANTLIVEVRQRGGSAQAPALVVMSKTGDQAVEIVSLPADQLAAGGPLRARIEQVSITPDDRALGVITLGVREGAGTATEKIGKGLELPIARRTAWDTPCSRP